MPRSTSLNTQTWLQTRGTVLRAVEWLCVFGWREGGVWWIKTVRRAEAWADWIAGWRSPLAAPGE